MQGVDVSKAYFLHGRGPAVRSPPRRSSGRRLSQGLRITPNVYTTLDEVDTFGGGEGRNLRPER